MPVRRVLVTLADEGLEYDVTIHAPYRFAEEIATAEPRFSNRFAVNLGAGDGVSYNDPVLPLYQAGWAGLAVEGELNEVLPANLPAPSIRKLIGTVITPDNVAQLLADNGCPESPDFLKLDIDGYDGPVLLEILRAGFQPKVIQLEVQPEIPPPVEFAVLYDPAYRCTDSAGTTGGFYGASLGYITNLGRQFGYFPVQLDFVTGFTHDVTLVPDRYRDLMFRRFEITELDDRDLFLAHPPGYSHFRADDGIDTRPWRHEEDHGALLRSVSAACVAACERKHGALLPFHLGIGDAFERTKSGKGDQTED